MDKLTILLVEDDTIICGKFNEYINSQDDVILVAFTNNASQALSHIKHYKPDVLILDLELHYGVGNGLEVLTGLSSTGVKPYVIITTNNSSSTTYEYARHLGADFIIYKHQEDYSEKKVIDFLVSMKNVIKKNSLPIENTQSDNAELQSKRMLQLISTELDLIGISRRSIGFNYLVEGIAMTIDANVPKLCYQIAKKHNKSEPSVERAMQNAINKAWSTTDIETLLKYYTAHIPAEKPAPMLTQFVSYYADRVKFMM